MGTAGRKEFLYEWMFPIEVSWLASRGAGDSLSLHPSKKPLFLCRLPGAVDSAYDDELRVGAHAEVLLASAFEAISMFSH